MSEYHVGYVTLFNKRGEVAEQFCRGTCDTNRLKDVATRKLKKKGYYSIMIEWGDYVYYRPGGFSRPHWVRKPKKQFVMPFPGMKEE